jgi:hypothetical protein
MVHFALYFSIRAVILFYSFKELVFAIKSFLDPFAGANITPLFIYTIYFVEYILRNNTYSKKFQISPIRIEKSL